jgi:hypothetical protein
MSDPIENQDEIIADEAVGEDEVLTADEPKILSTPSAEEVNANVSAQDLLAVVKALVARLSAEGQFEMKELFPILR